MPVHIQFPTCYAWIVIFLVVVVVVVTVGRVSSDAYEIILQHQSDVA